MPLPRALRTSAGTHEVILIAGFALAAGLLLGFGFIADEVLEGNAAGFDRLVFAALRTGGDFSRPIGPAWLQAFARDVTSLGSYGLLGFLALVVAGYLALTRRGARATLVVVAVAGGMLISTILKHLFDRPRPDLATTVKVFTASFPSGHATLSAITYLTLGAMLAQVHPLPRVKTYIAAIAILLTAAVGISRVYLGVHYASDVLAGWCLGGAWALLCWFIAKRWRRN